MFTVAGAPCIYYGDEIGLTGLRDPGCRGTFPWEKTGSWDGGLLAAFRSLALLRRAHAALRRGDHSHLLADGPLYVFERSLADERMIVAVNVGTERAEATLAIAGDMQPRWGEGVVISDRSGSVRLKIPGRSARRVAGVVISLGRLTNCRGNRKSSLRRDAITVCRSSRFLA